MFAKHIPLKSNHANAYRVLAQTSLCPADYPESREQRLRMVKQDDASMIQTRPITSANLDWQTGRFILAGSVESRKRHWRQILETPKSGRISR